MSDTSLSTRTFALTTFPTDSLADIGITPLPSSTPILGAGNYAIPDGSAKPRVLAMVEEGTGDVLGYGVPVKVDCNQYVVDANPMRIERKGLEKAMMRAAVQAMFPRKGK